MLSKLQIKKFCIIKRTRVINNFLIESESSSVDIDKIPPIPPKKSSSVPSNPDSLETFKYSC